NLKHVLEYGLLHVGLMDTDRATAQLHAVDHNIVVLAADLLRVALEHRNVLRNRRGERMVAGVPTVLLLIKAQQREVHHPEKIETVGGNGKLALAFEHLSAVEANLAEDLARNQPLIGGKQD